MNCPYANWDGGFTCLLSGEPLEEECDHKTCDHYKHYKRYEMMENIKDSMRRSMPLIVYILSTIAATIIIAMTMVGENAKELSPELYVTLWFLCQISTYLPIRDMFKDL